MSTMNRDRKTEDALHEGLTKVLQGVYDEYGIQILSLKADWTVTSLAKLTLETQTRPITKK